MSTSFGMFELKYFFSGGFRKDSGRNFPRNIKTFIKNIVNKEDCKKPLSDEKIANELKNKGINISRRTIAKYRSELDIPPSSKRKRYCI